VRDHQEGRAITVTVFRNPEKYNYALNGRRAFLMTADEARVGANRPFWTAALQYPNKYQEILGTGNLRPPDWSSAF
jgi:hypothetical protein